MVSRLLKNSGKLQLYRGLSNIALLHHKCHRKILDQDIGFIRNVLKEEKIEHDVVEV